MSAKGGLFFIGGFVAIWLIGSAINVAYATGNNNNSGGCRGNCATSGNPHVTNTVRQQQNQTASSDASAQAQAGSDASINNNQQFKEAAQSAIALAMTECHSAAGVQTRSFGVSMASRAEFCDHITLASVKLGLADGLECRDFSKGLGTEDKACHRKRSEYTQQALDHLADAEATTEPGFVKKLWSKVW